MTRQIQVTLRQIQTVYNHTGIFANLRFNIDLVRCHLVYGYTERPMKLFSIVSQSLEKCKNITCEPFFRNTFLCFILKKWKTLPQFGGNEKLISGNLEYTKCFHAISSSPKLSFMFLQIYNYGKIERGKRFLIFFIKWQKQRNGECSIWVKFIMCLYNGVIRASFP